VPAVKEPVSLTLEENQMAPLFFPELKGIKPLTWDVTVPDTSFLNTMNTE